jgi:hypothetical protein
VLVHDGVTELQADYMTGAVEREPTTPEGYASREMRDCSAAPRATVGILASRILRVATRWVASSGCPGRWRGAAELPSHQRPIAACCAATEGMQEQRRHLLSRPQ